MTFNTRVTVAREAIAKLTAGGLQPHELLHEVAARLRKAVPHDLGVMVTLDPDTMLPNARQPVLHSAILCRHLVHNAAVTPDVNKFSEMSRRSGSVAVLSDADDVAGRISARRHSILEPAGLADEVRVVFRAHGSAWGGACLLRERGARPLSADELRFLEEIAADVGRGLRLSLARWSAATTTTAGSGVLLVDDQLREVSATDGARHWQRLIAPEATVAINAIALRAHALSATDPAQRTRLRLTTGQWLVVTAERLHHESGETPLVAVTLAPAQPGELLPLLCRLKGLSQREQEVAELLYRGLSTDATAAQLHISRHTLRDHVKAIFTKFQVRGRSELMAVLAGAPAAGT